MSIDISIDFETRSEFLDVKVVGPERYAEESLVLCMAYKIADPRNVFKGVWVPPESCPFTRREMKHGRFHAFNASFERAIWNEIMVKRYGWETIPIERWHCTAARSLCNGLPASLKKSAEALRLQNQKDDQGHKVMLKLTKPRKETKNDKRKWFDDFYLFEKCIDYCEQDVEVEYEIQEYTYPMTDKQLANYHLSEEINDAGIPIDLEAVDNALVLLEEHKRRLQNKLLRLTDGKVKTARSVQALKEWLFDLGEISSVKETLNKDDVQDLLDRGVSKKVKKVLTIRKELSQSASDKVRKMRLMACRDGRVRGGHIYHKASTGRFAGAGLQPQNMKRGFKDPEEIEKLIGWLSNDYDTFSILLDETGYGDVNTVIAKLVRSFIKAQKGKVFYAADFAAIEARILAWLADESEALRIFHNKECSYLRMAERIYGATPGSFTKEKHADERQMGKQTVLGCGYQMAGGTFAATCAGYGIDIDEDEGHRIVGIYREANPRTCGVREKWTETKGGTKRTVYGRILKDGLWQRMEKAAIHTTTTKERTRVGKIGFEWDDGDLRMVLPSKRRIVYREAYVREVETQFGTRKNTLHFWGVNSQTTQWSIQKTYGGKLTENADQGTAADIQLAALRRLRNTLYNPVMHVHDEIICEVNKGFGSVEGVCRTMEELPTWAEGCPIEAEGKEITRYMKT